MDLYFNRQGEPIDLDAWSTLFNDWDYRQIADTQVEGFRVSTVWLGIDHGWREDMPPIIFETMVFGDEVEMEIFGRTQTVHVSADEFSRRYSTEPEARLGHSEVCDEIRALFAGADAVEDVTRKHE